MPGKIRVSALAKELGITSKQALAALIDLGVAGKTASSTVEQDTADRVREQLAAPADVTETAAAEQAPPEPAAAASEPEQAPAKKAPRKRASKKTAPPVEDAATPKTPVETAAPDDAEALAPAPAKKTRKRTSKKAALAAPADPDAPASDPNVEPAGPAMAAPGVLFIAPTAEEAAAAEKARAADASEDSDGSDTDGDTDDLREAASEQASGARRRRRRGRRGRGGGGSGTADGSDDGDTTGSNAEGDGDSDTSADDAADTSDDAAAETTDGAEGGDDSSESGESGESGPSSRRRRRRRRSASDSGSDAAEDTDDPPNTVTHVREPKKKGGRGGGGGGGNSSKDDDGDDGVRGVKGSTRLEAKRQRRRDGRDTSRRRAPILTEAEFLARREAVDRVMAVRQQGDRTQIAVLEDDVLVEHYVTRASATSYVGNVYLGRVQNVLPSMEAAFIDIGKGRNGVLYAGEVNWDAAGLEGKSRAIEQAMKSGDPVLVQVTKDPIGHKGARLTSQVSLPGRFVVYVPGGGMTGISRRLPDAERHRLKAILKKIVPEDAGVIVRTAAEGASEEDLTHDVERLQAQWEQIQQKSEAKKSAPVLVHGEPDLAVRVVRDVFNEDFKSLVVDGDDAWTTVSEYVGGVAPDLAERVSRHTKDTDLFHDLRIDEQLMKALDRKVWLPSGGSLVIDRTEAMTVVDVNTGKYIGSGGNLEQTVTRNNIEAAEEVVRQLRLRDVGGIIVIDFIDMVLESNRELVLRRLTECLGRDRTKHQVAEVTSLGLVQMTRKRVGEGLLEAFSEPCEHCRGRGVVVHGEPVDQPSGNGGNNGGGNNGGGNNGGGNNGGGNNGGGNNGGSDDDRPKGKRRRGGRGSQNSTPEIADDPDVSPAVNEERRRAAAAAIAAIHRAAEGGDAADAAGDAESAEVAELATGLVDAAQRVDATGKTEQVTTPPVAEPADPTLEAVVSTAASEVGTPAVETSPPDVQSQPDTTANGASAPAGRRRRRAASRPAGPPVGTP